MSSHVSHKPKVAVQLISLTVGFSGQELLNDINLEIHFGEIVGLAGPNGSGKTLLLKTIAGLVPEINGSHAVFTNPASKLLRFNPQIGMCIDGPGFDPELSGYSNLLRLTKIRKKVPDSTVAQAMVEFDLDPNSREPMKNYSLGMRQKIDVIQSYIENQQVLLLDEPFNALDEKSRGLLKALLRKLRAEGKAILFTSHAREDWADLVDTPLAISGGTITAGTAR